MSWTDEKKQQAVDLYKSKEPTADNSMEIVNEIATELEESPNGVRMILIKADVYVKKTPATAAKPAASGGAKTGGTRVSKEDSHAALKAAIEKHGGKVDDEIISKLTGKAAVYFTGLFAPAE